jgi:hypothetical protein
VRAIIHIIPVLKRPGLIVVKLDKDKYS